MELKLYTYKAKLVRVVDGDTIYLDVDLGMDVHVQNEFRLYGINTPEISKVKKTSEEYKKGMAAKARLEALLSGAELVVETIKDDKEKYGRYLAKLYANGILVNDVLVTEGFAVVYMLK